MMTGAEGRVDILAVSASPRRGSNSERIATAVLEAARDRGAACVHVRLRDYSFSSCVGCEACRKDKACTKLMDGMQLVYPLIERARGIVLVSPVHTYNVTAMMKAFIDRMYCFYDFEDTRPRAWSSRLAGQGRKAVVACVAEQVEEENLGVAMPAMTLPITSHDYEIVGELAVLEVFDAGLVRKRDDVLSRCAELGALLADGILK